MKKILVVFLLAIALLGLGTRLFSAWINCKDAFPNTCTQGGCESPQYATECWLVGCLNGKGSSIKCGYPDGGDDGKIPIYPAL